MKKKSLTNLNRKKEEFKKAKETIEEVLATGDSNAKEGAKAVAEVETKAGKALHEQWARDMEIISRTRKFTDVEYLTSLRAITAEYISTIDYKDYPGWRVHLYVTTGKLIAIDKKPFRTQLGLLVILKSPSKQYLAKGMKASFTPSIDSVAARGLGIIVEDTLDYYTGQSTNQKPEPNKLWTPN